MPNLLKKNFKEVTIDPAPYQKWIPGYSYFKDETQANLTSLGITTVIGLLTGLGYKITAEELDRSSSKSVIIGTYYRETSGYVIDPLTGTDVFQNIGWYISFSYLYKTSGGMQRPLDLHVPNNNCFDIPPTGTWINVPGYYTTYDPPAYKKQVPISGWNAGAYSKSSFLSTGKSSFSISKTSTGVFVGLSVQSTAIQDVRPENIKYAIYAHQGIYSVYTNNIKRTSDSSYESTDVFKIVINSTNVIFYKNNIQIYTESNEPDANYYVVDSSLYLSNDTIIDASIESTIAADAYSLGTSNMSMSTTGISLNYSVGISNQTMNTSGVGQSTTYSNMSQTTLGISKDYCIGTSNMEMSGQCVNYSSRMESTMFMNTFGLSKYNSIGSSNMFMNTSGESGTITPSIPATGIGYMFMETTCRNPYIIPPQVIIIT